MFEKYKSLFQKDLLDLTRGRDEVVESVIMLLICKSYQPVMLDLFRHFDLEQFFDILYITSHYNIPGFPSREDLEDLYFLSAAFIYLYDGHSWKELNAKLKLSHSFGSVKSSLKLSALKKYIRSLEDSLKMRSSSKSLEEVKTEIAEAVKIVKSHY